MAKKVIITIIVILLVWAFLRFVVGGPEDDWICDEEKGEWVKHGAPSAPKPTEPCGEAETGTCQIDSDCLVFGEDGDCNCGCFHKNHQWEKEGDCFCAAPESCRCVEGRCEDVFENIKLNNPRPNQEIESPLVVEGEAVGSWFFEGDFPIILTDWDGLIIAEGYAVSQGDWMTEEFVSFRGEIEFERPDLYDRGTLILQKNNPSGLPEHDDALEIPVVFKPL